MLRGKRFKGRIWVTLLKSSGGENPRDSLRFLDLLWERHRVHRSSMYQQDRDRKHMVTGLKRSHIWLLLMLLLVLRGCGPSKVGAVELSPAPIPPPQLFLQLWVRGQKRSGNSSTDPRAMWGWKWNIWGQGAPLKVPSGLLRPHLGQAPGLHVVH